MDLPRLRADPSVSLKNEVARNYFLSGDDLLARRDPENLDRAIICYRKAVANEPNAALAYASLASTLAMSVQFKMEAKRLQEASALAARAVELEPGLAIAHRAQAVCFYELGRFEDAIEAAKRALELDPTYTRAPSLLGAITYDMGRPDSSLRWYYWAERGQNQPGDYSCNIAAAWMALEQDDAAERALRDASEFRPELPYAACGMVSLRLLQHRWEEAWATAESNVQRFPSNLEARQVAAEAALLSGRLEQAEQHYRFLLSVDREGGLFSGISYLSGLAWICSKTGRDAEARGLLEEAKHNDEEVLRTAPLHPSRLYSLAGIAATRGDTEEALSWLEKATEAGWMRRRFTEIDPRFGELRGQEKFQNILSKHYAKANELRRQGPAEKLVDNN
jgi:tetratricopeptide (TPR) repeat protein